MSIRIQEEILWLEIAVNDCEAVQVLKCQQDLRCIELAATFREATSTAQMKEQFTSCAVLQYYVKLLGCLERIVQAHNERMADCFEHTPLSLGVINLVPLDHVVLPQHFHCKNASFRTMPDQHDF